MSKIEFTMPPETPKGRKMVQVNPEVHDKLKNYASAHECSISKFIEALVYNYEHHYDKGPAIYKRSDNGEICTKEYADENPGTTFKTYGRMPLKV